MKTEIVKTPEQFAQMTADEIAVFVRNNGNISIVGDKIGVDRHIIRFSHFADFVNYKNPYTQN